jgi:trk system potassium uptake protein TrkH
MIVSGLLLLYGGGRREILRLRILTGEIRDKEALVSVGLGWLIAVFFCSLPYIFSETLPNPIDAYFETMSGFTTTGATVIGDVQILPNSILFWRGLTQWLGGLGIILLAVLVLSRFMGGAGIFIKAEVSGHSIARLKPKILHTVLILWGVYMIFTIAQTVLLRLAGMSWFDALAHTFTTLSTGGFSTKNASIGYYSFYDNYLAIQIIIIFFMIALGVNFTLYPLMFTKKIKEGLKNPELKAYLAIIAITTVVITAILFLRTYSGNIIMSIRESLFQVSSIITTTGFTTSDYTTWPALAQYILLLLMFIGGCAGSTAGAIKVIRFVVLLKVTGREIKKSIHPRAVVPVTIGGKPISEDTIKSIVSFFFIYLFIFLIASILLIPVFSGRGDAITTGISAAATSLGNVGPGLGSVGPMFTYSSIHSFGKLVMIVCMWLGRIEIFAGLIIFSPSTYRR